MLKKLIQGDQIIQGDLVKIVDIKAEVDREVLRDVFQIFEGAETFIKERIEELCEQKKISVEEAFYFYIFFVFFVLQQDVNLPFS